MGGMALPGWMFGLQDEEVGDGMGRCGKEVWQGKVVVYKIGIR